MIASESQQNIILFSEVSISGIQAVMNIVNSFQMLSEQKINKVKSRCILPRQTLLHIKRQILYITGMALMPDNLVYLGMPLFCGKKRTQWFHPLLNKVEAKINGWRKHLVSLVGKSCLIQSDSNTMANYMNCYVVPIAIIKKVNFALAKLWWGKEATNSAVFSNGKVFVYPKMLVELASSIYRQ